MTDQEKINKLKELGWKLYHSYQDLTTDTRPVRKAMQEWYNFINFELNKED